MLLLCFIDLCQSLVRLAIVSYAPNSVSRNREADQFLLYSLIIEKLLKSSFSSTFTLNK